MDLIFEIIIKIAEFLSNTSWQVDESDIYSFLISEGYRTEDIRDALFWIRDAGSEARWRVLYNVRIYDVLKKAGISGKDWELFVNSLLHLYDDADVVEEDIKEFAEEFAKSTRNGGFFFATSTSDREN